MSAEGWPAWWETDREHAPALRALRRLRATSFIVKDAVGTGWSIDFVGLWEQGPSSSGERILIALAWCLYNLDAAAEYDREHTDQGPLYHSNPRRAIATLDDGWWDTYVLMVAAARGKP